MSPVEKKFYAKVSHIDENGCLIWGGAESRGYPYLWHNGRQLRSHRISFEINGGVLGENEVLIHECGNIKCVNFKHLILLTKQELLEIIKAKGGHNFLQQKRIGVLKDKCSRGHDLVPGSYYEYKKKNKIQRECKLCVKIRLQERRKKIKTEKNK